MSAVVLSPTAGRSALRLFIARMSSAFAKTLLLSSPIDTNPSNSSLYIVKLLAVLPKNSTRRFDRVQEVFARTSNV